MKTITKILSAFTLGIMLCSCEAFLQKPDTTGTVDQDAVYSSSKNAFSALMACYSSTLRMNLPGGMGMGHCTLGAISGEICRGYNWHSSYHISEQGLSVTSTSDYYPENIYGDNWKYIRQCFLVKENIDKVPDITDDAKSNIKGEVTALIAYRYMGMFYRYGGVPKVTKSFEASDDLSAGRETLESTLQYIIDLCDEAYELLPAKWDDANTGRMTKGAVLAIKARTLLFAARPLFNSATPYLDNGELNNLVCFGTADSNRWQTAVDANLAVLEWASSNGVFLINTGGAGEGVANPNAFDDYATATSTPSNKEIILAFKNNNTSTSDPMWNFINCSPYQTTNRYDTDACGILTNFLENYYAADGSELSWPKVGDASPKNGSDYRTNIDKIEPRALADIKFGGYDSKNNPGVYNWQNQGWSRGGYCADKGKADVFPNAINAERGCGERTKFYYKAGSRIWFEFPIFRLAETYMNLAEAYNELGDSQNALKYLNAVHNRAGLPAIKETDQARLRTIIQREDAIEFFQENHRYFDVKHWKRADIDKGICGGEMRMLQFNIKDTDDAVWPYAASWVETYWDAVAYTSFWSPAMFLDPIPQTEINKGTTTQNPGY